MRTRVRAPLAAAPPPSQVAVKPDAPQRPLGAGGGAVADLLQTAGFLAMRFVSGLSGTSHSWDDDAVGDRAVHTTEPYPERLVVESERLQRALRARLKEEEALRRVATLVAREHAPGAVLALVTEGSDATWRRTRQ
jgi:hypothetical protein